MLYSGICVDLETTIAGKCNHREKGQKRFETRIIEIGAVNWNNPDETFDCLVNPIPEDVKLTDASSLMTWLSDNYQKPIPTIQFWSKVLVKRGSLTADMFINKEEPEIWLRQTAENKAKDFVRWRNQKNIGPEIVSEKEGLEKLIAFTKNRDWLAHNGNSFDYKVLQGCSNRTSVVIPESIQKHDTLRIFRKMIPGYESYSQPKLYSAIFNADYNAHTALVDAKALAELCQHVAHKGQEKADQEKTVIMRKTVPPATPQQAPRATKKRMNLQFKTKPMETQTRLLSTLDSKIQNLTIQTKLKQIKGIGPKTIAALAVLNVLTLSHLQEKLEKKGGGEWLKDNLPFGANHKQIYKNVCFLQTRV
jgi:DNA polymerase III epsilon subunit-like protein